MTEPARQEPEGDLDFLYLPLNLTDSEAQAILEVREEAKTAVRVPEPGRVAIPPMEWYEAALDRIFGRRSKWFMFLEDRAVAYTDSGGLITVYHPYALIVHEGNDPNAPKTQRKIGKTIGVGSAFVALEAGKQAKHRALAKICAEKLRIGTEFWEGRGNERTKGQ